MIDITKYKNPLIVCGHGVRISNAIPELMEFLDKTGIPVVTTFNGFDIISSDHPNFAGRIGTLGSAEGNKALREADLVIFLGTRNNIRQISYKWGNFVPNSYKIGVDIDPQELWKDTVDLNERINMDVKEFINEWLGKLR